MVDLEDFDAAELQSTKLSLFLMATYGEGEPTDNAAAFYRWSKNEDRELEADYLNGASFAVFGLGNRQYEHFNKMGKSIDENLGKLGGKRVFELGLGDDDGSLEEDFDKWKEQLWVSLVAQFHPDSAAQGGAVASVGAAPVKLSFTLETVSAAEAAKASAKAIPANQISASTRHFFTAPVAPVVTNRELRNQAAGSDVGSTRHIEIGLGGTGVSYLTADNLAVLPENDTAAVETLARTMGYALDDTIVVKPTDASSFKHQFPSPCTVREALTRFFDVTGPLRHATVSQLAPYITDAKQQAWLAELINKEKRSEFKRYIEDGTKSLIDLLTGELSSARIPLADFFHIAPAIQPRYYTISSSSSVHPDVVHITVSVTEFKRADNTVFRGLCSSYLAAGATRTCRVFVRPSSFRLPASNSTPIIMIGPGTGLAPMRALLQERKATKSSGKNTLYFGCKYSNQDYIYRDELEAYLAEGVLSKLHLAFSRESKQKVYVQHLIQDAKNAAALVQDIDDGAYIYVCGATAMGADVNEAIINVLASHKKLDRPAAVELVKGLQSSGRYVQELWTA
jgi:NADPH-ferrihemoprotein reductase